MLPLLRLPFLYWLPKTDYDYENKTEYRHSAWAVIGRRSPTFVSTRLFVTPTGDAPPLTNVDGTCKIGDNFIGNRYYE